MAKYTILTDNAKKDIDGWITQLVADIRDNMDAAGVNASGNLRQSVRCELTNDGHILVRALPYFEYSEKGRLPGKIPYNFADILDKWITDKGLSVPSGFNTQKEFANAIAWKIKWYGSVKHRNPSKRVDIVGTALEDNLPDLDNIVYNSVVLYVNEHLWGKL